MPLALLTDLIQRQSTCYFASADLCDTPVSAPLCLQFGIEDPVVTPAVGLPIIMSTAEYTPLLHGFKRNKTYTRLRDEAFQDCKLHDWAEDPDYVDLVAKLRGMTGFAAFDDKHGVVHSLKCLPSVATQIAIERSHGMEVLHNGSGEILDVCDEERIQEVSEYTWRLRYQGKSFEHQVELARQAAGMLPAAILRSFNETAMSGDKRGSFTLFSAHDNTMMAMMAHLGFRDFPVPSFAAHLAFELHEVEEDTFVVRIMYNPAPEFFTSEDDEAGLEGGLQSCPYMQLPHQPVMWEDREFGDVSLEDFSNILLNARQSFQCEESWNASANGRADMDFPSVLSQTLERQFSWRRRSKKNAASDTEPITAYPLSVFEQQVAGHPDAIMKLGAHYLCKPLSKNEHKFYRMIFGNGFEPGCSCQFGLGLDEGFLFPSRTCACLPTSCFRLPASCVG
eukprot:m.180590 g.180590  ORF g.180590 m.180590 type:complete len:450 (+) comp18017_c0_seq4:1465-2814(+)